MNNKYAYNPFQEGGIKEVATSVSKGLTNPPVNFNRLKQGIKFVESRDGKYMKNPESSATGFYGDLEEIWGKHYKGTRDQYAKDTVAQNTLFEKRFNDELKDIPGLKKAGEDLWKEYGQQVNLIEKGIRNPTEISALANLLGRQGTREYIGYVLRDNKSLDEVFPSKYGENAKYANKTPEEYLQLFREATIKQDGGVPISPRGLHDYPKQKVLVPTSGNITMKNINYPVKGKSLNTGETKLMLPNQNYNFKNTNMVEEVPLLQDGGLCIKTNRTGKKTLDFIY